MRFSYYVRGASDAEFWRKFRRTKGIHSKIVDMPEQKMLQIIRVARTSSVDQAIQYISVLSLYVFIATAPYLFYKLLSFANVAAPALVSALPSREYLELRPYLSISMVLFLLSVPAIFLPREYMSSVAIIGRMLPRWMRYRIIRRFRVRAALRGARRVEGAMHHSSPNLERWSFRYIFLLTTILYLSILFIVVLANAFSAKTPELESSVAAALRVWLILPIPILCVVPGFLVVIFIALLLVLTGRQVSGGELDSLPAAISCKLIYCLSSLDGSDFFGPQGASGRRQISTILGDVARDIRSMAKAFGLGGEYERYVGERLSNAARATASLKLDVLLGGENSRERLSESIVLLLNCFLTSTYRGLPEAPYVVVGSLAETRVKNKLFGMVGVLGSLLGLIVFLALPLILWAWVSSKFGISLDDSVKGLLPIMYTIWCIVGVISASERFAPDVKSLVIEAIKAWSPRSG